MCQFSANSQTHADSHLNSFHMDGHAIESYNSPKEEKRMKLRNLNQTRLNDIYLVAVHPQVSLQPGPKFVPVGSNATLPTCHVTGYPAPVVTWRKSSGQLPQGRTHYNNSVLHISDVRKSDSETYFCSAVNLLGNVERKTQLVVISLPVFTIKPPEKVSVGIGDTWTSKCSATGDPRPVISWKRRGAALPVGRSDRTEDALILKDLRKEDAGVYICVATSAGVSNIEAISDVRVGPIASGTGKL